ncbi:hypothetical protein BHE74_00001379 [Ensete ventricosum]|nr:hypothetical protein BHE74_00001379 [Ensete ventricosum]
MRRILERLEAFGEFERLEMYGIPVPNYALINREYPYQELDYFVEHEDFVEILGKRFQKPFVEKPIDGKPAFYLASTKVVLVKILIFIVRYKLVMVDFDRRRLLPSGISLIAVGCDEERRSKRKSKKKQENLG